MKTTDSDDSDSGLHSAGGIRDDATKIHQDDEDMSDLADSGDMDATKDSEDGLGPLDHLVTSLPLDPPRRPDSIGRLDTYEVLNVVGLGGMGVVARAFDEQLHRNVAIKVMSERLLTSERGRKRFLREARAAASINHPNVVTIHAVNELGSIPYLVMEYVEGVTLLDRIRKDAPMAYEDVVRIGSQVAAGLAAAERHGVVHRDIKPGNIMLEDGIERVKLTDFGLARLLVENSDLTSHGDMVGTPSYMSPEQVEGAELGPESDLFSLGCVLYAMFLGKSPFHASSSFAAAKRVASHDPPRLTTLVPELPQRFDQLVADLLSKEPQKRPESAQAVADILLSLAAETRRKTQSSVTGTTTRRSKAGWWIAGLLLVGWLVVGIAIRMRSEPLSQPLTVSNALADGVLVVGPDDGEFATLSAALVMSKPGTVIALQAGRYEGPFELSSSQQHNGVVIRGRPGVILAGPGGASVLRIANVANLTIESITIQTRDFQAAVSVVGECPGLRILDSTFQAENPDDSRVGLIRLDHGASGTSDAPIEIAGCQFESGGVGVVIGANDLADAGVAHVRLRDNEIAAASLTYGIPVVLQGRMSDVLVDHNWIHRGLGGISVHFQAAEIADRVRVEFNTLSSIDHAFLLNQSPVKQGIVIGGNLVVEGTRMHVPGGDTNALTAWFQSDQLPRNQWITHSETEMPWVTPLFEIVPASILESLDPESDDYLLPSEDSPISVMGHLHRNAP